MQATVQSSQNQPPSDKPCCETGIEEGILHDDRSNDIEASHGDSIPRSIAAEAPVTNDNEIVPLRRSNRERRRARSVSSRNKTEIDDTYN